MMGRKVNAGASEKMSGDERGKMLAAEDTHKVSGDE